MQLAKSMAKWWWWAPELFGSFFGRDGKGGVAFFCVFVLFGCSVVYLGFDP